MSYLVMSCHVISYHISYLMLYRRKKIELQHGGGGGGGGGSSSTRAAIVFQLWNLNIVQISVMSNTGLCVFFNGAYSQLNPGQRSYTELGSKSGFLPNTGDWNIYEMPLAFQNANVLSLNNNNKICLCIIFHGMWKYWNVRQSINSPC